MVRLPLCFTNEFLLYGNRRQSLHFYNALENLDF